MNIIERTDAIFRKGFSSETSVEEMTADLKELYEIRQAVWSRLTRVSTNEREAIDDWIVELRVRLMELGADPSVESIMKEKI